eukprot:6178291-Amphidinium_carterae.1
MPWPSAMLAMSHTIRQPRTVSSDVASLVALPAPYTLHQLRSVCSDKSLVLSSLVSLPTSAEE